MPATVVKLGPGTVTVGTAPLDFTAEVVGAAITHEYEEVSEKRTRLSGDVIAASEARQDGFTASVENDLTAAGLYKFLVDNDLTAQAFEFEPNTADGASWTGSVVVRLPANIGADEFGAPIASEIEWKAVGTLTFTPGT